MGYLLTGKEPMAVQQEPGVLHSKDSSLGEPFKSIKSEQTRKTGNKVPNMTTQEVERCTRQNPMTLRKETQ